ncbi:hypothetical protein BJV74DRAFT_284201 [Russula compacta]|nr:hypothetical protein BJV74DRAFT_284201 [Russula compacta]
MLGSPHIAEGICGRFRADPIDHFQHAKICVLTDKPGRVFLETDQKARAFGNLWVPNEAIIFKDVCGKLEGESIVQASIQGASNLWYIEEPPLSPTSLPAVSPNPGNPSPTMTTSPTNSTVNGPFQDWKEPIRRGLISLDTDIRIRAVPPSNSSPYPSAPPFPIPIPCTSSSSSDAGLLSRMESTAHQAHISAWPIVASQQQLAPRLPARMRDRSYPTAQSVLLCQQPTASPMTHRATPVPTPSIALMPYGASTSREFQEGVLTKEEKMSMSETTNMGGPISCPSITVTPPSGVTNPHRLHTRGGEARSYRNPLNQTDSHSPDRKGATRPAPSLDAKSTSSQPRDAKLFQSPVWQFWFQKCKQTYKT